MAVSDLSKTSDDARQDVVLCVGVGEFWQGGSLFKRTIQFPPEQYLSEGDIAVFEIDSERKLFVLAVRGPGEELDGVEQVIADALKKFECDPDAPTHCALLGDKVVGEHVGPLWDMLLGIFETSHILFYVENKMEFPPSDSPLHMLRHHKRDRIITYSEVA